MTTSTPGPSPDARVPSEVLQRASRKRIREERRGNPSWTDLGDGYFALHIQYGGNATIVRVEGGGAADVEAFREWLSYHWPPDEP